MSGADMKAREAVAAKFEQWKLQCAAREGQAQTIAEQLRDVEREIAYLQGRIDAVREMEQR